MGLRCVADAVKRSPIADATRRGWRKMSGVVRYVVFLKMSVRGWGVIIWISKNVGPGCEIIMITIIDCLMYLFRAESGATGT